MDVISPSDDLYIEIEGEDWKVRKKKRIAKAVKKMSTYRVKTDAKLLQ